MTYICEWSVALTIVYGSKLKTNMKTKENSGSATGKKTMQDANHVCSYSM